MCHGNLGICQKNNPNNLFINIWMWYSQQFDPLFINTPIWLQIMCGIDCLIFGPMYSIIFYGWIYDSKSMWFRSIVLIWNGALVYSTIVYFAYEFIVEYNRISVIAVIVINIPWTIIPLILMIKVLSFSKTSKVQ